MKHPNQANRKAVPVLGTRVPLDGLRTGSQTLEKLFAWKLVTRKRGKSLGFPV